MKEMKNQWLNVGFSVEKGTLIDSINIVKTN